MQPEAFDSAQGLQRHCPTLILPGFQDPSSFDSSERIWPSDPPTTIQQPSWFWPGLAISPLLVSEPFLVFLSICAMLLHLSLLLLQMPSGLNALNSGPSSSMKLFLDTGPLSASSLSEFQSCMVHQNHRDRMAFRCLLEKGVTREGAACLGCTARGMSWIRLRLPHTCPFHDPTCMCVPWEQEEAGHFTNI